jgi:hypothetical protein
MRHCLIAFLLFALPALLDAQTPGHQVDRSLSIDTAIFDASERLDSMRHLAGLEYMSLRSSYDSIVAQMDKPIGSLRSRIDSLQQLKLNTEVFNARLDSLEQWKDEKLRSITSKIDRLKTSVTSKINGLDLPPALQGKANELTAIVNKLDVTLPTTSLPTTFQQGLGVEVPNLSNALNSQVIPDIDIPNSANLLNNQNLQNVTNINLPATDIGSNVQQGQAQMSQLPKDMDGITKLAEEQATNISSVADVSKELSKVGELTDVAGTLKDQEELKKELVEKVKEQAIDHFVGNEEQVKKAMQTVSKYKQKFSTTASLNDLPKKLPNEMKGKPLIERLVPGVAIQLQKRNDDILTDFNVYLGYRFTRRFTAGGGWNQRVGYNTDYYGWSDDKAKVYGPRIYSEYKLNKGFSPRVELEMMNTFVPPYVKVSPVDPGNREWVCGAFAGMKKDYKLFKKIKGTAMIMLRLFDPARKSPYADVINARLGFEFPMKKKVKAAKGR